MRPAVFLPKPLPEAAMVALAREFDIAEVWKAGDVDQVLATLAPHCRFAVCTGHWRFDGAFLDKLPKLEIVANYGVGYDSIDTAACAQRGIVATNTPDVLNDEVADTTIALLLAAIRRVPQADRYVREGKWLKGAFPLTPTLIGRKVGLVGYGRIGQTIAKRLKAFAIDGLCYHSRSPRPEADIPYYESLVDMARDVDVLIVIVPGGASTRHLVNRQVLEALGPGGCLVNVARGTVVDEAALVDCLKTGKLGMAGLDVFDQEPSVPEALFQLDNVTLLPHVGSGTHFTRDAMGLLVANNLIAWAGGAAPLTPVPETPVPADRAAR